MLPYTRPVRILLWHGWLLEGSGSNVAAARITEAFREAGHDVLLLCQASLGSAPAFIDRVGSVDASGVTGLSANESDDAHPGAGRAVLLRPEIGSLLPVFVVDDYPGFEVKRFVDLSEEELDGYFDRNVAVLRAALAWHRPDFVIASHLVPGGVIAARSVGDIPFVAYVHGSELEYAVRLQDRYAALAAEAMDRAVAVVGGSRDVLDRALSFAPAAIDRAKVVAPGVSASRFRPLDRRAALDETATLLESDPTTSRGRPAAMAQRLASVVGSDPDGPRRLAREYDQAAPDPDAATRLRRLAQTEGPTVAYLGKLIPQKGVELLIQALALLPANVRGLIIGFGEYREWLEGLVPALDAGGDALEWMRTHSGLRIELGPSDLADLTQPLADRITFVGRLDHRYAPMALAAADILVVPSVIPEAFGMVAAEAACTGCLPLVARHSGLEEVAEALEAHVDRPGLFGFQPGAGASQRIADHIRRLLALPQPERDELRREVSSFARSTWTWDKTAERLIAAAQP